MFLVLYIIFNLLLTARLERTSKLLDNDIVSLNDKNFNELVTDSDNLWMILFSDNINNDYSNKIITSFTTAASYLKDIIKVGKVDVDKNNELRERFKLYDLPIVKLFSSKHKDGQELYDLELHDIFETVYITLHDLIGGRIIELKDNNFDNLVMETDFAWFVHFYQPDCLGSLRLLTDWSKAAEMLEDKVYFGQMDATKSEIARGYSIYGCPTIVFFGNGIKKFGINVYEYNKRNTSYEKLVEFANKRIRIKDEL